jgi:23S rRNA pseudouridine1911/1915/1917 synthase
MASLTVPTGTLPTRLDVFLNRHLPHGSRRTAQRLIAAGAVRINGRRTHKGATVAGGDTVEVDDEWLAPPVLRPNPRLVVPVLYEDTAVLALDKPAGMPSHALRGNETETIANFLLAHYPDSAGVGKSPLEPGIVHRLDIETSGVLLVARTPAAYDGLRRQFAARRVRKEYRAVVHGDVAGAGEIRAPIAPARGRRRMRVCRASAPGGRPALTRYRPLERYGSSTLLAVEIPTGVRHQIRVHLAAVGHPVVGDRLYGPTEGVAGVTRHLLHAVRIGFAHPESGQPIEVSSPLPEDFTAFAPGQAGNRRKRLAPRA